MPRALLTRPRAQSEGLARELRDKGWDVDIWPLMDIQHLLTDAPDWQDAQAILFTSANGVRSTAPFVAAKVPAFCVGAATARAARQAGYKRVENAGADVDRLIALVQSSLSATAGPVWYPHGRDTTGDLAGRLGQDGFDIKSVMTYEAVETGAPPAEIEAALVAGAYHAIALFSPRSSALFMANLTKAAQAGLSASKAIAISPAAAAPLENTGFKDIIVARTPNAAAMRATISWSV